MSTTEQYIDAMKRNFQAGKAGGLTATFHLQVNGPGGGAWGISVANGQCNISSGAPAGADVSIGMSTDNYVKLANGNLNVMAAYQQGQVQVGGNPQLALKFTELFPPWASLVGQAPAPAQSSPPPVPPSPPPAPPSPPPAAEPVTSPPSPATGPTLADYVQAMPTGFRAGNAGGLQATYQFQLSGSGGGTWRVTVANGQASVASGGGSANVTIGMSGENFINLSQGKLNTVQAYQQGRVQIDGDLNLAAGITNVFGPWTAATGGGTPAPSTPATPAPSTAVPAAPAASPAPESGSAYPQLMNGGFNEFQPYIRDHKGPKVWKEDRFREEIGKYWSLNLIHEDSSRIHPMNSEIFGQFAQRYYGGGGLNYKAEGPFSQVIASRYGFDLAFYQQVAAQPGRDYTFKGRLVTYYKGTSPPPVHNKIFYRVGIDPTGGTDHNSASIVWGQRDGTDNHWRDPIVTAKAQAGSITVYIRLENTERDVGNTELNLIHLDQFSLE